MKQAKLQEKGKLTVQHLMQSLVRACHCSNANCHLPSCQKMKTLVAHLKVCKRKVKGECATCKQLLGLCCYHAHRCKERECSVPFCTSIKQKILQRRQQQQQLLS